MVKLKRQGLWCWNPPAFLSFLLQIMHKYIKIINTLNLSPTCCLIDCLHPIFWKGYSRWKLQTKRRFSGPFPLTLPSAFIIVIWNTTARVFSLHLCSRNIQVYKKGGLRTYFQKNVSQHIFIFYWNCLEIKRVLSFRPVNILNHTFFFFFL